MSKQQNKAIFLDRDGVINVDHAYVHKVEDFEFIDGVFEACQQFIAQGYIIVVVTNQSGIGRGYYDQQQFATLSEWMCGEFAKHQVTISKVYYCPHHPEKALPEFQKECDCRKPSPGMLNEAIAEFDIDVSESVMVGDKLSDIEAARAAGVNLAILVESGQSFSDEAKRQADHVCTSLSQVPALLPLVS
ncbi:D-glycero-beta-D-manno-heptose 1,7-bisphosphate 7-phosphatase [Pseudoalteromonas sp. MMG022]|uniref:D-glycero-beta-D-manno-heptose 1,7-bisphosphate 7-phosphatase n=1 Tax=Pseudoalteromonas sp. MMG022 TaxID=2909978 RepID=UPI001F010B41|nr:D-glycero-beta-D-manno-heptose 1,7-bisphosphate 7-phosphatase [Pseudoalteromonas sp. MMG022]MCF6435875.1 D-glycero-beta-D-manno-heptose 1,7-bisphosphate 7-phosphatase [Pseudoalteromonas sp. MMG022]